MLAGCGSGTELLSKGPATSGIKASSPQAGEKLGFPVLKRQRAHDLVYDVCREVIASGRPFLDLLAEHREIAPHLDRAALAKLLEPSNYLGLCGEMVDRVLAREG